MSGCQRVLLATALLVLAVLAPQGAWASSSSSSAPADPLAPRCQTSASNATCSFSCHAGDVIGASGVGGGGANATCGGASAACEDPVDCLDGGRVASSNGTGTCRLTTASGEYADCFALPSPRGARGCGSEVDYAACAFACEAGDELVARANSTNASGVGWPRVLSLCGGTHVDCQGAGSCMANGTARFAGQGICLSRTANTNVSCWSRAGNVTQPAPQNDAGSGRDAPPEWGGALYLGSGSYVGELRPFENDREDGYVAATRDHGRFLCGPGEHRVHVEGAGVEVRLSGPYGVFLATPADFRSEGCIGWAIVPSHANANATVPLAYSMVLVTPEAPPAPDFVVSDLRVNSSPALGATVPVSFVVSNAGDAPSNGSAWVTVIGAVGSETIAIVPVVLAPGESTTVNASWSTEGDVGRITVLAQAWPSGRELNGSDNSQRREVIVGPAGVPGVVGAPLVRLIPKAPEPAPIESALRTVDGACAHPIVHLVDTGMGSASPRACENDYNASNGGLYVPILGVTLCDPSRPIGAYRVVAEHLQDKPPCRPSVRDVAWSEAAILDPILVSVLDDAP